MLDQQKLTILKKDGNDPVITFASGGREKKKLIRNWILQNVRDDRVTVGELRGRKCGGDKSCISYWFLFCP